jgi:hypothetical protein
MRIAAATLLLLLVAPAVPAAAQVAAPAAEAPRIVERCDPSEAEILVCGDPDAPQPYRLPPQPEGFDPRGGIDSVSRERNKLLGTGPAGNGSCTTVGPGGWTGCDIAVIKQAEQQGTRVGIGSGKASIGLHMGRKTFGTAIP